MADKTQMLDTIVVGAGLTGLTIGHQLLKHSHHRFLVLERGKQAGGQIRTYRDDGFVFESGPTSGIISSAEVATLFEDFPNLLQVASPLSKRRMILKKGIFHPLPSGLPSAVRTTLFSVWDKLRILGEPFRSAGTDPNESIASLVRRRLGKSYLTYAVDPFVGGIYAGDPEKLVTRHALPKLYALEANHGSFIRGAIALMKREKTDEERKATKQIFSSPLGLLSLTSAMTQELIDHDRLLLNVQGIQILYLREEGKWRITYRQGQELYTLYARQVITTIGSIEFAESLQLDEGIDLSAIKNLRYAPIVQVAMGYKSIEGIKFDSFGGLIPSCEDKEVLGILNPSACFSDRCPQGGLLLSIFLGGMRSPELIHQSDEYITALVQDRVSKFLDLHQAPDLLRIFRHTRAIPQYEASSDDRLALIELLERTYPGLYIGGNMHGGIGMSDRIKQGTLLAYRALNN